MSFDDLQASLRDALEQQLGVFKQQYEQAIAGVRQEAAADVEREAVARVSAARAEWETEVASIVEATRTQARAEATEAARAQRTALEHELHQQLEQTVQHAVGAARKNAETEIEALRRRVEEEVEAERVRAAAELEAALADERTRAQQAVEAERRHAELELEAERTRAKAELETVQQLMEAEIASVKAGVPDVTAARVADVSIIGVGSAGLEHVPGALRLLDSQPSVSAVLSALVESAGEIAGRAALFMVNGDRVGGWTSAGAFNGEVSGLESPVGGPDVITRAIQTGEAALTADDVTAPDFAQRTAGQPAVAVPFLISGRVVGVLYADTGDTEPSAGWMDGVDLVTRHASTVAALRAATRTLDILRGDTPAETPAAAANGGGNGNGDEGARRYARLLVSEIKLYNEAAVRAGRQQRDLGRRLQNEIDRARRLYEERVPPAVTARDQFFQQELVQTLADGDATLLGS